MKKYYDFTSDGNESHSSVYGEIDLSKIDNFNIKELKDVRNDLQKKKNRLLSKKEKPSTFYLITFGSTAIIHVLDMIFFSNEPNATLSLIQQSVSFPNAVSIAILSVCLPVSIVLHLFTNKMNKKIDLEIEKVNQDIDKVKSKLSEKTKNRSFKLKYGNGKTDTINNNVENDINKTLKFRQ